MTKEKLFKMVLDCDRMGCIEGLFIALQAHVDMLDGEEICFGEVLGKHYEVCGTVGDELEIEPISDDPELIAKLKDVFNSDTICGYNPFDYYEEEEQEDDDD